MSGQEMVSYYLPASTNYEIETYQTCPHVIVLLYRLNDIYSTNLKNNWADIMRNIIKISPKMRYHIINQDEFNAHTTPNDLNRYCTWSPMIILIHGVIWNRAILQLGPNNPFKIENGIQIFNGYMFDSKIYSDRQHEYDAESIVKWVSESLLCEEFQATDLT